MKVLGKFPAAKASDETGHVEHLAETVVVDCF